MKITLKNLFEATAQQVFNQVAEHLLFQMKVSNRVSNDEYDPKMECGIWLHLIEKFKISNNHFYLISRLQKIHDEYEPEDWKQKLVNLSKEFNLEWKF